MTAQSSPRVSSRKPTARITETERAVSALDDLRSTTPATTLMFLVAPVPSTQCPAVSTTRGAVSAPPQPIDSRTIHGNIPGGASPPPTTSRTGREGTAREDAGAGEPDEETATRTPTR